MPMGREVGAFLQVIQRVDGRRGRNRLQAGSCKKPLFGEIGACLQAIQRVVGRRG